MKNFGSVLVLIFLSAVFASAAIAAKSSILKSTSVDSKLETAMFGAGCFWGVEETFRTLPGVKETDVGYAGGKTKNPTYKDVCTDATGHAEVVRIKFDPKKVSFQDLLEVFFKSHNPTTMNRQGPDIGTQYRSVIFYYSPEQKATATKTIANLTKKKRFQKPIVTVVEPAPKFYLAEDYHQEYLKKQGKTFCHN